MPTAEELIKRLKELAENTPERRSERMQILVTPSMAQALEALSKETKQSKNEIVNLALSAFLKEE